jgi:PIN domain
MASGDHGGFAMAAVPGEPRVPRSIDLIRWMTSPTMHRLAAGLSEREVEIFLDAVVAMAEPVKTHFLWRPQLRDPGDEMVLETAVNGRADALVTFNVRDYGTVPARFGIEVMIPRDAIGRMRR